MLPPYGKILKSYLDANIVLPYPITLFVGRHAFQHAKGLAPYQVALCLPLDEDVAHYDWPVKGLKIIIEDTGGISTETIETIAYYLICEQAAVVCIHSPLFDSIQLFNKDILWP